MARPIIVAGATTQAGAAVGPVQLHGDGPYSRTASRVKWSSPQGCEIIRFNGAEYDGDYPPDASWRSEPRDPAVQVVLIGALDHRGDDLADLQRAAATEIDRAVDLRRVGL